MMHLKKFIRWAAISGFAFLVIFALIVCVYLDNIVKVTLEKVGTEVTQTGVEVDSVSISLLKGGIAIRGLKVKNPAGYEAKYLLSLNSLRVDVNFSELLQRSKQGIVSVKSIVVEHPQIEWEGTAKKNNFDTLTQQIQKSVPKTEAEPSSEKLIRLNELYIKGADAHVLYKGPPALSAFSVKVKDFHWKQGPAPQTASALGADIASDLSAHLMSEVLATVGSSAKKMVEKTGEALKNTFKKGFFRN